MIKKDTSWVYSDKVKEHFFNPKNLVKDTSKLKSYDGIGQVGSPACGDMMKFFIKVDKKSEKIIDLKWQTFGCGSAIGSTSMLSEMVLEKGGMKVDEALKLTPMDIVKKLDGLPTHKIHCSVLGDQGLRAAINDYFKKTNQEKRMVKIKGAHH